MASSKEHESTYTSELNSAIRRYRWVVSFPSFNNLLILLFATSVCSWFLSWVSQGLHLEALYAWVLGFALIPLIIDSIFLKYGWHNSLVLDRRRLVAISVTCNIAFITCILIANVLTIMLSIRSLILTAIMFGMSVHFFIRLAAFSTLGEPRISVGSASLYLLITFAVAIQGFPIDVNRMALMGALGVCWILSILLYSWGLAMINRIGISKIGIPSLIIFNAYLKSRLIGSIKDLERILDKLGEEKDIDCWLVLFKGEDDKNILGLASTSAHFGPFDNVGSGGLSHELRLALEEKLQCPVAILRELSDHRMDLTSKRECEKLIREFPLGRKIEDLDRCSPLITKTYKHHIASSLVSDGFCLILLSRAPIPTEDLPGAVRDRVLEKLAYYGIKETIVVDAHNCIGNLLSAPQEVDAELFAEVAGISVAEASNKVSNFQVGFYRKHPPNVSIDDGLGPDGISAVVFKHDNDTSSLIIIDGNNMVVGLRDKIRDELSKISILNSEIITTDTHLVTGLSRVQGGYNPLGVKVTQDFLMESCKELVFGAIATVRPARILVTSGFIRGIKVVGTGLARLAGLLEATFSATKIYLLVALLIVGLISYLLAITI